MTEITSPNPSELIVRARTGDVTALSQLVGQYRPYLKLLARLQQDNRLKAKLDDSDMVQEVLHQAVRDFSKFLGKSEAEFTAWLRSKMAGIAARSIRHYTTRRRDIQLERKLRQSFDSSSNMVGLATSESTPSEHALKRERAVLVADALNNLPQHYCEVVILREFEGLSLSQIASQMNRSPESLRKIWARAVVKMRQSLKDTV